MKYRWIALIVALLLLAALPAFAEERLPDCFGMEEVIRLYNDQLVQSFLAANRTQAATKVAQYKTSGISPEGNEFIFNNQDGQVQISAWFPDGDLSMSEPPVRLGFTYANGVDYQDIPVLKNVFANVISRADSTADLNAVLEWMNGATRGSEVLQMNGYVLLHERNDVGHIYALAVEAENGGEPAPGPDKEPEPEPKSDPIPGTVSDSGPDIINAPEPEPTHTPRVEAGTLLSWKGFELTPLRTERWQFSSGQLSLRLYLRVVNGTKDEMSLRAEDVTVDGVSLPSGGIYDIRPGTDTGADSEANILFYPEDNTNRIKKAVLEGKKLSMKLVLRNDRTREDVYMEKVSLDLSELPDETTVYEPSGDPTPTPAATRKPEATRVTPKASYKPLFEGDKGEDVRRMQRKLIDLGYLTDSADGSFGPRTAAAVREFCETNGLGSDSYASAAMLEKLYSGNAKPYQEPWVPLIFLDNARGQWQNSSGDKLSFRAKVTNTSRTHTVRAFEFYMYATDVWGDKIYGDSIYYGTTSKAVKPGQSVFSDYFLLPNRSRISKVWCGVKKVIFSDGTIRENSTVDYGCWTVR